MSIVCILNGNTSARERDTEEVSVLACGCAHTRGEIQRWLQMCQREATLWQNLHDPAAAEHARQAAIRELTS